MNKEGSDRIDMTSDSLEIGVQLPVSERATAAHWFAPASHGEPDSELPVAETPTILGFSKQQIDTIVKTVPGGGKSIQDVYPLSPLQEGMLFHHLLNKESDTYVLSTLFETPSKEQARALIEALQMVVDRHDILRSAVLWEDLPRPVQVVHRRVTLPVEELVIDADCGPIEKLKWYMRPGRQQLDVSSAPLLRLLLAADPHCMKWYVLLQVHHLVSDHQSLRTIIAEAMDCLEGRSWQLPPPVPFRAYVAHTLEDARTQDSEAFFRGKLGDVEEPTAPFGLLDVHGDGSQIEECSCAIESATAQQIRGQARRAGVSAARFFHAAWGLVVARTSGRDDVVYGTVLLSAQQRSTRGQRMLGMAVNTLPLRLGLQGTSARQLVQQTHQELVDLLKHESAPLTLAQRCSGAGAAPLFTSLLNYRHSVPDDSSEPSRSGVRVLARGEAWTNFPVAVTVDDLGDNFVLAAKTDRRVDPQRVLGYLSTALQSLVEALEHAPDTAALTLPILPAAERRQVIELFNATRVQFPRDKLLHELFEQQVAHASAVVAVVCEGQAITYFELNSRANQLARYLRNKGVGPDTLVGICVERSLEMLVGLLGIWKAGGAYVPLDPDYPTERLQTIVKDAMPRVLLIQERLRGLLPDAESEVVALDDDWAEIAQYVASNMDARAYGLRSHHLAYVIYTSGSTGQPKGVMVEHRSVLSLWQGLEDIYRRSPCERIAVNASFNFDASVKQFVQLLSGRTIVLIPPECRWNVSMLLEFVVRHRIDGIDCTPSQLRSWLDAGLLRRTDGHHLRAILVGGEPIDAGLWSRLSRCSELEFYNVYGPTESTVDTTIACLNDDTTAPHIGRPMENRSVYILDRYRQPVPIGVAGEIYIGGAGVARGYLNRPELTEERFFRDPFVSDPQARMYKTGDLGKWRADGRIEYLGRNDQQVKIRGFRIELGEIEAQLLRYEQIKNAVVIAREDIPNERRLVAYVIPQNTSDAASVPSAESLRTHLQAALPEYMVPSAYVVIECVPLTPQGKVDRRALPAPGFNAYANREYEAPRGYVEEMLARIWQVLLGHERVGRSDNFFELGGHSLLAMQVVTRMRSSLSIDMPIRLLFQFPTIGQLSTQLENLNQVRSNRVQTIRPYSRSNGVDGTLLPTSWAQQRLWFIDQLEQGTAAYNSGMSLRLRGTLDQKALQRALDTLVQRHETLRTVFVTVEGDPRQQIAAEGRFALDVIDLSGYPQSEGEAQVRIHKMEEMRSKFDLRVGPLIRGRLLGLSADEHVLMIMMHHIVSDGWSKGVLIREFGELYRAYREGWSNPLVPLPVQYADYAQWQRQCLQEGEVDRQLSYWRTHMEGAVPQLRLPTDRPRPEAQSYRGENVDLVLDARLYAKLRAVAQRHNVTLFMVLCAAWAVLLSRLSGQEDVVIGTPIANRQRPELESLIGFFVNTLALRVEVRSNVSVEALLDQVKEVTLGAYDHQDVPFERIVEAVQPQRSLAHNPLFQVMLVLQNSPKSELKLSDLRVIQEDDLYESSIFDLLLMLEEKGDQIIGRVNYATDLFDKKTVERWTACFTLLLSAMTDKVQTLIRDLPILPERERLQIIESFNATRVPYSRERLVHELFEDQVQRSPDAIAAVHKQQTITYAEINVRANQVASYLRKRGVGPDELVGICVDRSLEMVVGLLGILKAGGAYVPLDPNYPTDRLKYMLEDAAPMMVLTQEKLKPLLPPTPVEVIALDAKVIEIETCGGGNILSTALGMTAQNLVYVIYTSGSTGRPKGTAMAHRSMTNLIEWHRNSFYTGEGHRVLQFAPLSFDVAFQETFSTLCTGNTLVLLDEWVRRDTQELAEFLSSQAIQQLFVTPLMLQSLAERFNSATATYPAGLRDVITAGEQLRITPEIARLFRNLNGCRLHNHYGPTETHVVTALTLAGDPTEWPAIPEIGRPISNTQIYVLDAGRQPVPIGVTGEICIGGSNVARGYLNRPELTAERFHGDPFSGDPQSRLYRTGDMGRLRADGMIEYLGRNDGQVKVRGYRIELGEIEAQLARHEKVRQAAVLAREDIPGEKRLVAYVTLHAQNAPSAEELRSHLRDVLPEYMVPAAFVILQSLPQTPSGKLNRLALPPPDLGAYAAGQYEPPQGDVEEVLGQVWQELLQVERIGREDNFFELGGHSLLAAKAVFKINQSLGSALKVTDVYNTATIRELAARISGDAIGDDDLVDLSQEAALDGKIVETPGVRCAPARVVMLTGATGFVGRFLLTQLLQDTDATVYCLVRAGSQYQAMSRLKAMLTKWDLWRDEFESRIVSVPGDLRLPRLGVDELSYLSLSREVDSIYHCGTSMNHLETYEMAKPANVGSAKELLKLATNQKPKLINYISALGVFSSSSAGTDRVVDEASPIDDERHPCSRGYAASKWVGEKIFMLANERGIPCNIFRLGLVWADTQRGRYDELQRGYRIIKSCLMSGCGIRDFRYHSPPTPVDYAARAVVHLADRHFEGQGIFHISSPRETVDGIFERCNEVARTSFKIIPLYDWICEVRRIYHEGRSLPVLPLVQYAFSMDEGSFYEHERRIQSARTRFDCSRTHQELKHAGIVAPVLDDDLLRKCVESMLSRDEELREFSDG